MKINADQGSINSDPMERNKRIVERSPNRRPSLNDNESQQASRNSRDAVRRRAIKRVPNARPIGSIVCIDEPADRVDDSFSSSKTRYPAVEKHEGVIIDVEEPYQWVVSRGEEDAGD